MPGSNANNDWAAPVDAVAQRTPEPAAEREQLSAQVRLLALLGSAAPLNVLLDGLATYIETWSEGLYCSVLLVDPTGQLLRPGAAPSLPAAYVQAINPVPIGIGQGSCGTAAARREIVVVEDVERSELWTSYARSATAHGLRACWSVPILDDRRELLGTLAMYYGVPRKPSTGEIDLIHLAASLAGFVIRRHRDAAALRTAQARLNAAIGATVSGIGLWDSNQDGDGVWFDDWCERVGIDPCNGPDRLRRWCAQIHPDDVERYRRADGDCVRGAADHYFVDYRIRTRGGDWRWLQERGNVAALDAAGVPSHYVGVCFDIDEQKRMEAALHNAEACHELAINAARLPVWEYDVRSDTVRGNTHWHRAIGYDLSEQEARERTETWLIDMHPEDASKYRRIVEQASTDTVGFFEADFRIKLPSGQYKWLLDRARVVERSATGAVLKIAGVSLDIDARKRMESDLRESEERFRSAFEFAAIGMAMVAPDGRFLRVNQALCRIVGYPAEELLRLDFQTITHPDDLGADVASVRKMLDGTLSYYDMEKRYFHKEGQTISVLLSVSLVRDEQGQPCYFISQIQDITERKRLERALLEATSSEQQRLGRELHDGLGQELTGLSLLARAFATDAERAGSPLAADAAALAAIAKDAIETCRSIVHGVSPLTATQGSLVGGIRQLVDRAEALSGQSVRFDAREGALVHLTWDARSQLYRIVQEALNNAIAHAGASNIEIDMTVDALSVRIEVTDDGRGFVVDSAVPGGFGIETMRFRAAAIGARLLIAAKPGGGTAVTCECPQPPA